MPNDLPNPLLENSLVTVLSQYSASFRTKVHSVVSEESDLLMEAFSLDPTIKNLNRQYWGRELGMCWQRLVVATIQHCSPASFSTPRKFGNDEPYDLGFEHFAIDTKYRIGSGDSGTLKKFKQYGDLLRSENLSPLALFLRTDNLPAAISALQSGGWKVLMGKESFDWIANASGGFRLDDWLLEKRGAFAV